MYSKAYYPVVNSNIIFEYFDCISLFSLISYCSVLFYYLLDGVIYVDPFIPRLDSNISYIFLDPSTLVIIHTEPMFGKSKVKQYSSIHQ